MKGRKLKLKDIKPGERVYYTAYTKQYGTAEFVLCIKYNKAGIARELWIHPAQQPDAKFKYRVKLNPKYKPDSFSFMCLIDTGESVLNRVSPWLVFGCPEHKTQALRFYVPKESNYFRLDTYTTLTMEIGYKV